MGNVPLVRGSRTRHSRWTVAIAQMLIGIVSARAQRPLFHCTGIARVRISGAGQCQRSHEIPASGKCSYSSATASSIFRRRALNFNLFRIQQGFGMLLMEEAERIAREEHGSTKLAVISGVGTRNYYAKMGYTLDGPYMSKSI